MDRDDVALALPPEVLRRYDARLLDPTTAPRSPGTDAPPRVTAYRNRRVLVTGLLGVSGAERIDTLQRVLDEAGYALTLRADALDEAFTRWVGRAAEGQPFLDDSESKRLVSAPMTARDEVTRLDPERRIGALRVADLDAAAQTRVYLVSTDAGVVEVDPWEVVLAARSAGLTFVDLEHLVIPGPGGFYWGGQGPGFYWGGQGPGFYWGGQGPGFYWGGQGDSGTASVPGRTPVSVPLPNPYVGRAGLKRQPVVVVPDTGIGEHPWFGPASGVAQQRSLGGWPVLPEGAPTPFGEATGVSDDLTGVLDDLSGHGTFVAGVVRQLAPQARIVGLPVLDSAGLVAEHDIMQTLDKLLALHSLAQERGSTEPFGDDGGVVDVLNLSLGFYHQDGEAVDASHPVRALMGKFAQAGVLVVTAAGNQGTRVPLYPAGWALPAGSVPAAGEGPPLVSVGAHNPDGATVAMFSNSGPWVTTHRPGVNVVSTAPTTFNASSGARWQTEADGTVRGTPDPDDLSAGFMIWSGTSFAAPWLVGQLASRLAADDSIGEVAIEVMCKRAVTALTAELKE